MRLLLRLDSMSTELSGKNVRERLVHKIHIDPLTTILHNIGKSSSFLTILNDFSSHVTARPFLHLRHYIVNL